MIPIIGLSLTIPCLGLGEKDVVQTGMVDAHDA